MKKTLIMLLCLFGFLAAKADVQFPTLSTDTQEIWYYVQMQRGMAVLTVQGAGQNIVTANANEKKTQQQTWKVVSAGNNRYTLISRTGQMLYYDTSASRFRTAISPSNGYKSYQIVTTTNTTYEGFELFLDQKSDSYAYLNQWGGYGADCELGAWTKGDPNNTLQFIPESEIEYPDEWPSSVSEVSITGLTKWTPPHRQSLWYSKPATVWMTSALPIGNGQFGATVMGGVRRDEVQFNDKTLWRGHLGSLTNSGAHGCFLDFGHLFITSTDASLNKATHYRRWLDMEDARAGVAYTANDVDYVRDYFVSYPDDVLVVHYSASEAGHINERIFFYNCHGNRPTYSIGDDGTGIGSFRGQVERTGTNHNLDYHCEMRVVTQGGTLSLSEDGGLQVDGADEMTIYLLGATNFSTENDDYIFDAKLLPEEVKAPVTAAVQKGYEDILADHTTDFHSFYDRCRLQLSKTENSAPTATLISKYASDDVSNLLLEELYFSYGRYLLISCSRGVDLPSNLQGIWNNSDSPAWNSDIHTDINVQMNYWPAEVTNLSDLHLPFLNYVKREACDRSSWRKHARDVSGQTVGWMLPIETNIYGSGSNWTQTYSVANAWYCMHLWQHYAFTLDKEYLRETALPAMKSCCEFWLERLVKASDGTWECPREYSPEHGPVTENATAHGQQLVWDLFNNTLQAYDELGIKAESDAFIIQLRNKFEHLDKGLATEVVNGTTLLREWKYTSQNNISDYDSHRHLSHLMALYPGNQIAEEIDVDIFNAARNSLNARGYEGTGWALAWKIALHARCHDGELAHQLIKRALQLTTNVGTDYSGIGGIYENLWDAHPPFQIDGNFGTTAAIADMLLQSHLGKIELLPALPSTWVSGQVQGLRAVGNFAVDITWDYAMPMTVTITSYSGQKAVVKYPGISTFYTVKDGNDNPVSVTVLNADEISFDTAEGQCYVLTNTLQAATNIPDGDYLLRLYPLAAGTNGETDIPLYFYQKSEESGDVGITTDASTQGAIWTLTRYEAANYPKYSRYRAWQSTGSVYYLYNRDFEFGIRDRFNYVTRVNANSLHPILVDTNTGLLAIRATNLTSEKYQYWYGADGTTPIPTQETPQFCWQFEEPEPTGIQPTVNGQWPMVNENIYDLQGRRISTLSLLSPGIYILTTCQGTNAETRKIIIR